MARARKDKPSVATYADHEIISPSHKLRQAISKLEASARR